MRIRDTAAAVQQFGAQWLFWRSLYALMNETGSFAARFPSGVDPGGLLAREGGLSAGALEDYLQKGWANRRGRMFLPIDIRNLRETIGEPATAIAEADAILEGKLRFFSGAERTVGSPPDWMLGAGGVRWPDELHWSRIPDLSQELGDIKEVWEPARFSHTFTLARAYALTGDQRYPEGFWQHLESWIAANPPESGPHWRCGQEMAFRCLAWLFGLYAFENSPTSTSRRIQSLISQIWYHGRHIEKIHWYARRCVRNNHAISEAAGLFSIGTLLPWLPRSRRWRTRGLERLASECSWQVYDDGAYVQHSMNYSRLVGQLLTWTLSLARANGETLPPAIADRAGRVLNFLLAMQDSATGSLPNYGSNDGALIFRLSSSDFADYRPALQALQIALGKPPLYSPGPWDEETAWFGTPSSQENRPDVVSAAARSQGFEVGGYYTLRGRGTHAAIRCGSYRHRPAQADMLHLDVWCDGANVLIDPGTFSYNPPAPWDGYFVGTASHNTVSVDGRDQMRKGPRFMWLDWTRARVLRFEPGGERTLFEGEQYGYHPIVHRRTVLLDGDVYTIVDELFGNGEEHSFRLHWLVGDLALQPSSSGARIELPGGRELRLNVASSEQLETNWVRACDAPPRGWHSRRYGERLPAWSFAATATARSVRFVTLFGPLEEVDRRLSTGDADVLLSETRTLSFPASVGSVSGAGMEPVLAGEA